MNRSKIANLGSQTGSQRHPIPGFASRQRIGISAGQRHIGRHQPTAKYASAVARNEQVVGSIPTGGSTNSQLNLMIGDQRLIAASKPVPALHVVGIAAVGQREQHVRVNYDHEPTTLPAEPLRQQFIDVLGYVRAAAVPDPHEPR